MAVGWLLPSLQPALPWDLRQQKGKNMLAEYSLEGKIALVRGADTPVGRAIATALAEAGANIAITGVDGQQAEETAQIIRGLGRRTFPGTERHRSRYSTRSFQGLLPIPPFGDLGL